MGMLKEIFDVRIKVGDYYADGRTTALKLSGFDPNQPRAGNGRWSDSADTGGGSGGLTDRKTGKPFVPRGKKPAPKPPTAPKKTLAEATREYHESSHTRQLREIDEISKTLKPFGTKKKAIADKVVDSISDYLAPHSDKIEVAATVLEAVGSIMQSMGLSKGESNDS